MNKHQALYVLLLCAGLFIFNTPKAAAQLDMQTFKTFQLSQPRVAKAFAQYNEVLRKEFESKGFSYPAEQIYIRTFKAHNEMEVWVKEKNRDTFALFKNYKICALSGVLGPKR